ncbi:hypothetical protein PRIPAC_96191 [Pristionchus pacificus]|uniref:Hydrolase n=1 Tax=Pristionchus pacificus TaxID=54126 RepID=A0A2A6D0M5_PRIPA|nr:hypothetical protein PRIPAC_96191 [Pristionchus pacificus]|eukprot:PDM83939.1 hydrolase [Pristionchus pacificus]
MGTDIAMRSLILVSLCFLLARAWEEISTDVEVDTPRGRLKGRHVNFGSNTTDFYYGEADIFLGIPYVLPPQRFKRPVANCQYTNDGSTLTVQQYGPSCYQAGKGCPDENSIPMSEDCLTLNVFTPDVTSNYKYPVMVYIHGGGLMYGCAAEYPYDGAVVNMVNRGVVVVTIQYRLSTLGFFTTYTEDFPSNLGMLDQVEALRWVKDQISHFGGDPFRITIFGQSAGGASVSAHTFSPLSQDLFQQAIMESGVALTTFEGSLGYDNLSRKRAQEICKVSQADFDNGKWDKMSDCLYKSDPKDLVKLDTVNIIGWKISAGDDFMPDIPNHLAPFRNNIPVLIGSMHDEWAYYDMQLMNLGIAQYDNYSREMFEFEYDVLGGFLAERKVDMLKILEDVYAGVEAPDYDHNLWMRAMSGAFTSAAFTSFIQRDFMDYLANGNKRMWLYEMTYPKAIGRIYDLPNFPEAVFHTAEVSYLWKRKKQFNEAVSTGYINQDDYDLSEWFGATWTNFAKYGQPYLNDEWPNIPTTGPETYMEITGPKPVININNGYKTRDNIIWNQVLVALHGDFFPAQFSTPRFSKEDFDKIKANASLQDGVCSMNDPTQQPPTMKSTISSMMPTTEFISSTLSYFSTTTTSSSVSTDVEVDTPRGRLKGRHVNFGSNTSDFYYGEADIFLGIPYVLPPQRFKRSVANCQYTNDGSTLTVQQYGPACYQAGNGCPDENAPMSEDCLTLNVFTPDVNSNYKYPVMLYIHGGGLMFGCAGEYPYDGAIANLVNRGVVVVTFQYRLSTLGFFTTYTEDFPSNLGMLDQVEALRWVKDQISHFGGDPFRITLFGQSAGAASVSAHTYSPLSQDLFQQAITESCVALATFEGSLGYDNLSRKRAQELCHVSQVDFDTGKWDKMSDCLYKMDPKDLVKLDAINVIGWKISSGDDFMPDIPNHLAPFRNNIPILMGSMHDEWSYYDMTMMSLGIAQYDNYTREMFEFEFNILGSFLGDRKKDMLKILEDVYAGVEAPDDDHNLWMRAMSGVAFTSAAFTSFMQRDFQDYLANGNKRMWLYLMTYPKAIGRLYDLPGFPDAVFHNAELAYLWKMKKQFNEAVSTGYVNNDDYDLSEWFGATWTNFAKYGRPCLNDDWPNIPTSGPEIYMDITGPKPVIRNNGFMSTDNIIWNQVLVALHGDFFPAQFSTPRFSKEDFDKIKASASLQDGVCAMNDPTQQLPITTMKSTITTMLTTTEFISSTLSYFSTTTTSSSLLFGWNSIIFVLLVLIR